MRNVLFSMILSTYSYRYSALKWWKNVGVFLVDVLFVCVICQVYNELFTVGVRWSGKHNTHTYVGLLFSFQWIRFFSAMMTYIVGSSKKFFRVYIYMRQNHQFTHIQQYASLSDSCQLCVCYCFWFTRCSIYQPAISSTHFQTFWFLFWRSLSVKIWLLWHWRCLLWWRLSKWSLWWE